jgi:hypothetical protein
MRKLMTAAFVLIAAIAVKAAPVASAICASGKCPLCR